MSDLERQQAPEGGTCNEKTPLHPKKENPAEVRPLLETHADNTCMHGPGNIHRASGVIRKGSWIIITLFGSGMLLYMSTVAVMKYYTWPADTHIDFLYSPQLNFPAVTICNLNPLRKSELDKAGGGLISLFDSNPLGPPIKRVRGREKRAVRPAGPLPTRRATPPASGTTSSQEPLGTSDSVASSTTTTTTTTSTTTTTTTTTTTPATPSSTQDMPTVTAPRSSPATTDTSDASAAPPSLPSTPGIMELTPPAHSDDMDESDEDINSEEEAFTAKEDFFAMSSMLPPWKRARSGHDMRSMMLFCSFNSERCTAANFTSFLNYLYGNCFTFNADRWTLADGLSVNKVGPLYGLNMELYVEQDEYIADIADSAGVHVVIHNQTDMPFPEDGGFSAQPGTKTSIGIKRLEITRAEEPYGSCRYFSEEEHVERNAFAKQLPSINYTSSACKKTCYQQHVVQECGCFDMNFPFCHNCTAFKSYVDQENTDIRPCANQKKSECVRSLAEAFNHDALGCAEQCPSECFSVLYENTISTSTWPSMSNEDAIVKRICRRSREIRKLSETWTPDDRKTFVRENLLKLEVYYEDLSFQTIVTQKSYGVQELLSELGGQAGLWVGLSIIALFEIVELFLGILVVLGKKCTSAFTSSSSPSSSST